MSKYFKDLAERVVTAFATGMLSVIGLDAVNLLDVDWRAALGIGGGAALVELLKGLAARGTGSPDSAGIGS